MKTFGDFTAVAGVSFGLFELWDRRDTFVKQFSGGMKRRLALFEDSDLIGGRPQHQRRVLLISAQSSSSSTR